MNCNEEAEQAFDQCKRDIANAAYLAHPIPNAKLVLFVGASDFAVGAEMHQVNSKQLQPLGFYSKRMTITQKRYSTYERELLAIYQAVKSFKFMIEGRECTILIDHYVRFHSACERQRQCCYWLNFRKLMKSYNTSLQTATKRLSSLRKSTFQTQE